MPKVYGSITISDIADVGRLSVYLTSNQPQTVIENPNGDVITYTPDWTKSIPFHINSVPSFSPFPKLLFHCQGKSFSET